MKIIKYLILSILLIILSIGLTGCGGTSGLGTSSYEGTWTRQETIVDGDSQHTEPATLILTKDSFETSMSICSNSGSMEVIGNQMIWTIEKSDCPGPVTIGSSRTMEYTISGNTLTIINRDYGMEVKEIYQKN